MGTRRGMGILYSIENFCALRCTEATLRMRWGSLGVRWGCAGERWGALEMRRGVQMCAGDALGIRRWGAGKIEKKRFVRYTNMFDTKASKCTLSFPAYITKPPPSSLPLLHHQNPLTSSPPSSHNPLSTCLILSSQPKHCTLVFTTSSISPQMILRPGVDGWAEGGRRRVRQGSCWWG